MNIRRVTFKGKTYLIDDMSQEQAQQFLDAFWDAVRKNPLEQKLSPKNRKKLITLELQLSAAKKSDARKN